MVRARLAYSLGHDVILKEHEMYGHNLQGPEPDSPYLLCNGEFSVAVKDRFAPDTVQIGYASSTRCFVGHLIVASLCGKTWPISFRGSETVRAFRQRVAEITSSDAGKLRLCVGPIQLLVCSLPPAFPGRNHDLKHASLPPLPYLWSIHLLSPVPVHAMFSPPLTRYPWRTSTNHLAS